MKKPSADLRRLHHSVEHAVIAAARAIPKGHTWSKMEVFRKALQKLGRGDEGIDTGIRTRFGSALSKVVLSRRPGWYRIVASDGNFLGTDDKEQLTALQREGARPRPMESVSSWAQRRGLRYVGTYRPSLKRVCLEAKDPGIDKWPAWSVEPLQNMAALKERLLLSGGKVFHLKRLGENAGNMVKFKVKHRPCALPPKSIKEALKSVQPRVRKVLTKKSFKELQQRGATRLRQVLTPKECAQLLKEAEDGRCFDEIRRLDGEAGQGGSYHFCRSSAPFLVEALRQSLYDQLVSEYPQLGDTFGKSLAQLERNCKENGQKRCATIFLAFGEGGQNLAHQDPYGKLFFPYQAMLMLSHRGTDFTGGEFFVKNMKTGEAVEVAADVGDVTIFAANKNAASVAGQSMMGTDFKHGVRTVAGERFSVGIVFNRRN